MALSGLSRLGQYLAARQESREANSLRFLNKCLSRLFESLIAALQHSSGYYAHSRVRAEQGNRRARPAGGSSGTVTIMQAAAVHRSVEQRVESAALVDRAEKSTASAGLGVAAG